MSESLVKEEHIKFQIGKNILITNKRIIKDNGRKFQDLNLKAIESIEHKLEYKWGILITGITILLSLHFEIFFRNSNTLLNKLICSVITVTAFFIWQERKIQIRGSNPNSNIKYKCKFEEVKKIRELHFNTINN